MVGVYNAMELRFWKKRYIDRGVEFKEWIDSININVQHHSSYHNDSRWMSTDIEVIVDFLRGDQCLTCSKSSKRRRMSAHCGSCNPLIGKLRE